MEDLHEQLQILRAELQNRHSSVWQAEGQILERSTTRFGQGSPQSRWCAVRNPAANASLQLVPATEQKSVQISDWDAEGMHIREKRRLILHPGQPVETLCWLAALEGEANWKGYAALANLHQLP